MNAEAKTRNSCFAAQGLTSEMTHAHNDVEALQVPSALHTLTSAVGSLWVFVDQLSQKLELRRQEFRSVQAAVEGILQSQEDCECLDVGGTRFHVGRGALGGRGQNFFSMLVSNEFPSECGSDGCVFIDRDPEHFALVLHYLREGEVHVPLQWTGLLREATYYGLQEFSTAKHCLTILPCGSAAHVYDAGGWQRLVSLTRPPYCGGATSWSGALTALVKSNKGYCVDLLDPISLTWKTVTEFAVSVYCGMPQIAAAGARLFCTFSSTAQGMMYTADGQWEVLPRMAEACRCAYAMCAMGDGIVVAGGMHTGNWQDLCNVERYSLDAKRWEPLPNMTCARCCPGATVWQGKLIVVGGRSRHGGVLSSVEAYDPDTGAWQAMPPLLHAREYPQVVVYADKLIVLDGLDGDAGWVEEVEQYHPDAQLWKVIHCVEGGGIGAAVSLPRRLWTY